MVVLCFILTLLVLCGARVVAFSGGYDIAPGPPARVMRIPGVRRSGAGWYQSPGPCTLAARVVAEPAAELQQQQQDGW